MSVAAPEPRRGRSVDALLWTISASRLTCFLQCRLKFYFRYVLGIVKPKPLALRIGSAVHLALKAWNRARWRGELLSLKDIYQLYSDAWQASDKVGTSWVEEDGVEGQNTGFRLLDTYVRESPIKADEKPEAVEVSVEADLAGQGLPKLIGILDLVRPKGRIVDFKTIGRTPDPDQAEHLTETQTTAYSILYREAVGKSETAIEIHNLVKLKSPKLVVMGFPPSTESQRTRLHHLIESYVDGLQRSDFVPSPGMQCASCEYLCECRNWK